MMGWDNKIPLLVLLLVITGVFNMAADKKWSADIEGGLVVSGYNNLQIPNNDEGTRFSLKNDLNVNNEAYYRLRLTYQLGKKSALSLLFAPLSLNADGTLPKTVKFEGASFAGGTFVNALYKFNSYRLTYRFRLARSSRFQLWVGFTAKIRDAEVKLESAEQESSNTNVGFVPLLNVYLEWVWGKRTGLIFEADALAAKQGRAEDVAASLFYRLNENLRLKFGYRFVEGGADSEDVYTFTLINYFYGGIIVVF